MHRAVDPRLFDLGRIHTRRESRYGEG
jgi:hypothetical protein